MVIRKRTTTAKTVTFDPNFFTAVGKTINYVAGISPDAESFLPVLLVQKPAPIIICHCTQLSIVVGHSSD
jgi:hypothetical protein